MNATPEVLSKAHRLADSGAVSWERVAVVQGDHGTYVVRLQGNRITCTCAAGEHRPDVPCSHILAAAIDTSRGADSSPDALVPSLVVGRLLPFGARR